MFSCFEQQRDSEAAVFAGTAARQKLAHKLDQLRRDMAASSAAADVKVLVCYFVLLLLARNAFIGLMCGFGLTTATACRGYAQASRADLPVARNCTWTGISSLLLVRLCAAVLAAYSHCCFPSHGCDCNQVTAKERLEAELQQVCACGQYHCRNSIPLP